MFADVRLVGFHPPFVSNFHMSTWSMAMLAEKTRTLAHLSTASRTAGESLMSMTSAFPSVTTTTTRKMSRTSPSWTSRDQSHKTFFRRDYGQMILRVLLCWVSFNGPHNTHHNGSVVMLSVVYDPTTLITTQRITTLSTMAVSFMTPRHPEYLANETQHNGSDVYSNCHLC
jgi:hypothetical protein